MIASCYIINAPSKFVVDTASQVHGALVLALATGHRTVDLDCSNTHYIDSAAVGAVLAAHKAFLAEGGELRWTGVSEEVASLLELTRIDRLMFVKRRFVPA